MRRWAVARAVVWALAGMLRLHNAVSYPIDGTFDAKFGHLPAISHVRSRWSTPPPEGSWEGWQPPLYYWLAAGLWATAARFSDRPDDVTAAPQASALALLSAVLSLLIAWLADRVVRRLLPGDRLAQLLALVLVLFWPMHVMLAAWVRNDLLAILTGSAAIALFLHHDDPGHIPPRAALVVGALIGLSLLSKYTGLAVLAAVGFTVGLEAVIRRNRVASAARTLALVLAACAAVSGWLYTGRWLRYGTPFVTSHDLFAWFGSSQGVREARDYLWFAPAVFAHPWVADPDVIRSVWAGTYATAWFDGQYIFLNHYMSRAGAEAGGRLLLAIGVLPTLAMAWGAARAILLAVRNRRSSPYGALVILSVASAASYAYLTFAVPYSSSVKAHFLLMATVPFAVFLALGVAAAPRWLRTVLALDMAGLLLAVTVVFWFG